MSGDGAEPLLGAGVLRMHAGDLRVDALVNCTDLHSDRIARLAGMAPASRCHTVSDVVRTLHREGYR